MIEIMPLEKRQYDEWYPLWQDYLVFYESSVPEDVTKHTWARFFEEDEPMWALGAFMDGKLVGFTHYLFHRSTWALTNYCYLEDLFTLPECRGQGVGRALIEAVRKQANEMGADSLYWLTEKKNKTGRILYDKVAKETGFIHYEKEL